MVVRLQYKIIITKYLNIAI